MKLVNEQTVLFDGTCFLYIHGANPNFSRSLKDHIYSTLEILKTPNYIGILDGKGNYRIDIAVTSVYKGNRNKSNLLELFPYYYQVKEELITKYKFIVVNGIEADDMVGILNRRMNPYQTVCIPDPDTFEEHEYEITTYTSIIATIDKDSHQLPACIYNLKSHTLKFSNEDTSRITLTIKRDKIDGNGFKFFYAQILMGDSTDNIQGLYKCGPVGAYEILKDCRTPEECEAATIKAFIDKEPLVQEKLKIEGLAYEELSEDEEERKEQLEKAAMARYYEMRNLVFILRKNATVPSLLINNIHHVNKNSVLERD